VLQSLEFFFRRTLVNLDGFAVNRISAIPNDSTKTTPEANQVAIGFVEVTQATMLIHKLYDVIHVIHVIHA
jgi:hypothetical protein